MSILPTWPIAAGALALGLAGGAYIDHKIMQGRIDKIQISHTEELRVREVKRAEDERVARQREQAQNTLISQAEQRRIDETAEIRTRYDATIAGLQQRANRKPAGTGAVSSSPANCQGSTGADLSRQDAVFLAGEAASAVLSSSALGACYKAYDSLR